MENARPLPRMEFVEATKRGFKNLFNFKGRARRSEYWWYALSANIVYRTVMLAVVIYYVIKGAQNTRHHSINMDMGTGDMLLIAAALLLPAVLFFAIQVRRLHDIGRSGILAFVWFGLWCVSAVGWGRIICLLLNGDGEAWCLSDQVLIVVTYVAGALMMILQVILFVCNLINSQPGTNEYGRCPK